MDHLFVFRGKGTVEDFPGNYSDYRAYEDSAHPKTSTSNSEVKKEKKSWKKETQKKLSYNEQKEYQKLERDIKNLSFEKKELEAEFTNASLSQEEIQEKSKQLEIVINTIEKKEERWLELSMKLED